LARAKLMDKVLGFMGFEEVPEEEEKPFETPEETLPNLRKKGQVLSLHSQRQTKVVVVEPKVFDEVQAIADSLKNHRAVIINLEHVDADMARRVIDFVIGCTYALDGSMQKVGSGIFLSVPSNMDIASEAKDQPHYDKSILSWIK
jgi:cell division inhibitor SepF